MRTLTEALAVASLAVLVLSGCTGAQQAVVSAGVVKAQQTNDTIAVGLTKALCGMTIGAYHRALSDAERRAVTTLCGGSLTVTADDVTAIRRLMEEIKPDAE